MSFIDNPAWPTGDQVMATSGIRYYTNRPGDDHAPVGLKLVSGEVVWSSESTADLARRLEIAAPDNSLVAVSVADVGGAAMAISRVIFPSEVAYVA